MKRVSEGLGALILSAALLVGLPAALIFLAGNPIPSWDRLVAALTMPDYGGEFLVDSVIPIIAWIAWATFAIGYIAEIPNQVRVASGQRSKKRVNLPGFGLQQKAAGVLIAAILAIFAPTAAMAATPTTADMAPTTVATSVFTHTENAETTAEAPDAATVSTNTERSAQTYTVQSGDSLWAIAQQYLGDGNRYEEIIELNRNTAQPGGYTVGQRSGIDPGMILTLPAAAAADVAPAAAQADEERTIVAGDTLWGIAEDELGAGERYTEIYDASSQITQADGQYLSDPSLILPGWTVVIPAETTTAEVASVVEEPITPPPVAETPVAETPVAPDEAEAAPGASGAEAGDAAVTDTTATTGADEGATSDAEATTGLGFVTDGEETDAEEAPTTTENLTATDVDETDEAATGGDWADIVTDWRTLGIGGVLAAGLLGFLGLRRMQQRRNRKPGTRIALPSDDINTVELELRAVENPQGMEAVDHALRMLALWAQDTGSTLPALYALRLSEAEVSVFLDEPTLLPAPFRQDTDDEMAWSIGFDDLTPLERIPSAPYPALVTLGHDETDAHLLVDLERLGALNIASTPELEQATLTALALELATSTWAENLQVTLVGVAAGLPEAIGSGRVRHVDTIDTLLHNLRAQAEEVTATLKQAGIASLEQARTAGPLAESWTPEIIVLGQQPDEETRAELAELVTRVPRVGIAAIAAGHLTGSWNFRVTDRNTAELEIPDTDGASLALTPQVVTQEEYNRILALFTVANEEPAIEHSAASAEVSLDEIFASLAHETPATEPTAAEEPAADHLVDENPSLVDQAPPSEASVEISIPLDDQIPSAADAEDTAHLASITPLFDTRTPRLQLLGPVAVLNPQGEAPKNLQQWNSQQLRAIELVAFVATHPDARTEQVHEALWPGNDPAVGTSSRNRLTTAARRWLGKDAAGHNYLVPAAGGVYSLTESFTSDWDDWRALVGANATAATTENLVRALSLVKGQPISGVKEKYYVWSEKLRQDMIAEIGDAAHELATRALRDGNTRNARMAAAIGRMVDPINEVFWRDALRAEHMAGDISGVERLVAQLSHALTQIDPDYAEPEQETEELITQLRRRHAIAS